MDSSTSTYHRKCGHVYLEHSVVFFTRLDADRVCLDGCCIWGKRYTGRLLTASETENEGVRNLADGKYRNTSV